MNALKLYWTKKRQESIATLTVLLTSSLVFLVPAFWYPNPLVVLAAWLMSSGGILGHALCMIIVHHQQHKAQLKFEATSYARLLTHIILLLSLIQAGAAETTGLPSIPPGPETIPPFEADVSIQLLTTNPNEPNHPQAVIPAAVCVGVGVGIIGWIGIKLWSACLDIQLRRATNKAAANFQAAAEPITQLPNIPSTSNPVTGSGCVCQIPPTVSPLPLLLEHTLDGGQSWSSVSVGMKTGQRVFVPDVGTWRITPMKIVATRNSMLVPPGTLETSVDLNNWTLVSVSALSRTITPEPNHFYRIR